jgi:MtfA peptidase
LPTEAKTAGRAAWSRWRQVWQQFRDDALIRRRAIPDDLWQLSVQRYPFIALRTDEELSRLRRLSTLFLNDKEFSGAQGMQIDDEVAVAVALQACLPILNLGLSRYEGFKGIVVHADEVLAQRIETDEDGVVHEYAEPLSGEAMQGGPVMLSWPDVSEAGETAAWAYNVVIHEFAHVLDMHSNASQAHLATPELREAHQRWLQALSQEFQDFADAVNGGSDTLLDPYGAESIEEFFAVASEAFFVQAQEMRQAQSALYDLMRDYYRQDPAASIRP